MRRTLPTVVAAVTLLAGRAHATPLSMYGMGSRASAMGGAVTADVSDPSANYYNPAGLAAATRVRLDLGYVWASHQLKTNGLDNGVDPAHGIAAGIVAPGQLFGIPFAFGLGLYLPDDRLSRSRSLPQSQPRWELYDNRVHLLDITANIALAPLPWLRFGGGVTFVSSTRGQLDITGAIAVPDPSRSSLTHTVDADLTTVRYPQAGIQVQPLRNLTFGFTWRGSFDLALNIDAAVRGEVVVGSPNDPRAPRVPGAYTLSSRGVAVHLPHQLVLGVAWKPRADVTLVLDVTYIRWSSYVNPTATLTVGLDLTVPPAFQGVLRVPALPPVTVPSQARFHDTLVPRIGVEWTRAVRRHRVAVRGGYRFDPTPVPEQTAETNFLDCDRHAFSVGAGFHFGGLDPVLPGGLSIDLHGEMQALAPRTQRKDSPVDPVGDLALSGFVWIAGATMGVTF